METKVLKLKSGQDILEELEKFAEKNNIEQGFIVSGFGKIKNFKLSSFAGGGKIENFESNLPADLASVSGEIRETRGKKNVFLRARLKRAGLSEASGVLLKGKAVGDLEIEVKKSNIGRIIQA